MIPVKILVLIGLLLVVLLAVIGAREFERKLWNGGRCKKCGASWEWFDVDSQGGWGFVCRPCHQYIWISYLEVMR